jgi:RNA polymerase sigma factor (sigma-70 family)
MFERLVEAHRPMVASVGRRCLRDPNDVEDVVQETFLKLAKDIDSLNGSIPAWLASTAQAGSVNLIRREVCDRNRRWGLAQIAPHQQQGTHEAIRMRLHDAMLAMDPPARELLSACFGRKTPLGVLATQRKLSVPTVSRRVAQAVGQLTQVLRDMGVRAADDCAVAQLTTRVGGERLLDDRRQPFPVRRMSRRVRMATRPNSGSTTWLSGGTQAPKHHPVRGDLLWFGSFQRGHGQVLG